MGLLGRKVFISTCLQFSIVNYQELFAKYDFISDSKFAELKDKLPQEDRAIPSPDGKGYTGNQIFSLRHSMCGRQSL